MNDSDFIDIEEFQDEVLFVLRANETYLDDSTPPTPEEGTITQNEIKKAEALIKKNDIRDYICAALKSGADDVFSIAKVIIPILLPLSMAGTITVPPDTLSYAAIALVVSKMGIAALCVDYGKKEEENE